MCTFRLDLSIDRNCRTGFPEEITGAVVMVSIFAIVVVAVVNAVAVR